MSRSPAHPLDNARQARRRSAIPGNDHMHAVSSAMLPALGMGAASCTHTYGTATEVAKPSPKVARPQTSLVMAATVTGSYFWSNCVILRVELDPKHECKQSDTWVIYRVKFNDEKHPHLVGEYSVAIPRTPHSTLHPIEILFAHTATGSEASKIKPERIRRFHIIEETSNRPLSKQEQKEKNDRMYEQFLRDKELKEKRAVGHACTGHTQYSTWCGLWCETHTHVNDVRRTWSCASPFARHTRTGTRPTSSAAYRKCLATTGRCASWPFGINACLHRVCRYLHDGDLGPQIYSTLNTSSSTKQLVGVPSHRTDPLPCRHTLLPDRNTGRNRKGTARGQLITVPSQLPRNICSSLTRSTGFCCSMSSISTTRRRPDHAKRCLQIPG